MRTLVLPYSCLSKLCSGRWCNYGDGCIWISLPNLHRWRNTYPYSMKCFQSSREQRSPNPGRDNCRRFIKPWIPFHLDVEIIINFAGTLWFKSSMLILSESTQSRCHGNSNTPGSWLARTAKNPVVPTTVNKNAACTQRKRRITLWKAQDI